MRIFCSVLLAAIVAAHAAFPAQHLLDSFQSIERVRAATWLLTTPAGRGPSYVSTCVMVLCEPSGPSTWRCVALTVKHAGPEGSEFMALSEDPEWSGQSEHVLLGGRTIARHADADVQLIEFETVEEYATAKITFRDPIFAERVRYLGFPSSHGPFLTEGLVSGPFLSSAAAYPGNSGGPVVDSCNMVLGIVNALIRDNHTLVCHASLFVPSIKFKTWLQENL